MTIDVSKSGLYIGDCRQLIKRMPDCSVHAIVTSPPYYGLRDYGHRAQIGLEPTLADYVRELVAVFSEARRVLRDDGTLWLNLGDSYYGVGSGPQKVSRGNVTGAAGEEGGRPGACNAPPRGGRFRADGLKPKDLIGAPWRVALALQDDGWWLRQDNVWSKPNPMPESVKDRSTRSHEYVFHLAKSEEYYYDRAAVAEPSIWEGQNRSSRDPVTSAMPGAPPHRGLRSHKPTGWRNLRSVWTIAARPFPGAHFATMSPEVAERCILAGCPEGGVVLDLFFGAGTTGLVAEMHGRRWIGFDLGYEDLARERLARGLKPPRRPRARLRPQPQQEPLPLNQEE